MSRARYSAKALLAAETGRWPDRAERFEVPALEPKFFFAHSLNGIALGQCLCSFTNYWEIGGELAEGVVEKNRANAEMIREFITQGLTDTEIANRMDWTVGTLRVRCSQLGISLRRSCKKVRLRRLQKIPIPTDVFEQLHQRAALMGISAAALAVDLLKEIARDGLYDAVLDRDDAAELVGR